MSEAVLACAPMPVWLRERFLRPGERVVWWRGPDLGPWRQWVMSRHEGMGTVLFLGFFAFPLLGAAIVGLCGGEPSLGVAFGAPLGFGSAGLGVTVWSLADKYLCHVLTDRRLLVIKALKLTEEFDLDLLRRLLAISDDARPASVPTDEHVLDPSKVRPLLAPTGQGVTEIEPILRLLRAFGQLQAPARS